MDLICKAAIVFLFIAEMLLCSVLPYVAATLAAVSANNYCSNKMCNKGIKHVACGHSGKFDKSCPCNARMVSFTDDLRKLIVDGHNTKRNFIAGGGNDKISPACRMATMEWDTELADLAAFNVKQCQMAHDRCHNTNRFKFSGQNLAWISFYGNFQPEKKFKETIEMWYNEVKDCQQSYLDSYPMSYFGPDIGHFTVMMADRNIRVGCAAATYTTAGANNMLTYLMACNYATTNMLGSPIYAKCDKAAVSCTSGTNSEYRNLCSTSEKYDVNKWN